ncbi:MAG: hypothetical protein RR998_10075 [Oscillospiraceae bacterium]
MKKLTLLLFAVMLTMSLFGCAAHDAPQTLPGTDPPPQETAPPGPPVPPETPSVQTELLKFDKPHIEVQDFELKQLIEIARPFFVYSTPFGNVFELTDSAMFFAAVTRLDSAFAPLDDGYSYSLEISELKPVIHSIFGPDAALSETWQSGNYEPYLVDAAAGTIVKYSLGQPGRFFFPYACVASEGGYELWLLDLNDPLFSNVYPDIVQRCDESAVTWDMIAPYARELQASIFTFSKQRNGEFYISAFRFRNLKTNAQELS